MAVDIYVEECFAMPNGVINPTKGVNNGFQYI